VELSERGEDKFKTFRKGAVGFWQDKGAGEAAQYANLVITEDWLAKSQ